jgi:hypothetical protein
MEDRTTKAQGQRVKRSIVMLQAHLQVSLIYNICSCDEMLKGHDVVLQIVVHTLPYVEQVYESS